MTWRKWREISLVAVRVWLVSVMNERLSQLLAEPSQLCRNPVRAVIRSTRSWVVLPLVNFKKDLKQSAKRNVQQLEPPMGKSQSSS
jgi:hypothetical protein